MRDCDLLLCTSMDVRLLCGGTAEPFGSKFVSDVLGVPCELSAPGPVVATAIKADL